MGTVKGLVRAEVEVTHPDLDGPLIIDFLCTNDDDKIIRRAKVWTMHMYRDSRFTTADTVVTILDKSDERPSGRDDA